MTTPADRALLDRRLIVVTGKGGTGKTTVTAALALAASRRGKRVLAIEVGRYDHLSHVLDSQAPPAGYEAHAVSPNLLVMRIDPFDAMAEYLELQLHSRTLVDLLLRNKPTRQLMAGAPGWRELITLGKIWHLEQMRDPAGRPRYDLIVVDAPATGHGVTFLDVPRVVRSAVSAGPLGRNASLVEALIRDRERTLLLPVSLAEELPAQESGELVARMRDEIGIAVDRIAINAVAPAPFPPDWEDLPQRLEHLPRNLDLGRLPSADVLTRCAVYLDSRRRLNLEYVETIARRTGLPVLCLPFLAGGLQEPRALEILADGLLAGPGIPSSPPHVPASAGRRPTMKVTV